MSNLMHVLIFANGAVDDGPRVQQALHTQAPPFVVAADGGARVAGRLGYPPHVIIGDMDSLTEAELRSLAAHQPPPLILRHPPEKDETDLELALKWVVQEFSDIHSLVIIGGLGGRFDQTLANVYLLALPELAHVKVCMVDGSQSIRLLRPGQHTLGGTPGDTISLIPLGGSVSGIQTHGLYYPLRNETLHFGPARGVSNVIVDADAHISLHEGVLLMIHTLGRA